MKTCQLVKVTHFGLRNFQLVKLVVNMSKYKEKCAAVKGVTNLFYEENNV